MSQQQGTMPDSYIELLRGCAALRRLVEYGWFGEFVFYTEEHNVPLLEAELMETGFRVTSQLSLDGDGRWVVGAYLDKPTC